MIALTKRQADCIAYLRAYVAEHGCAPTLAEIAAHLGLSPKSKSLVNRMVGDLAERGLLRRVPNIARGIELTEPFRLRHHLMTMTDEQFAEAQRTFEDVAFIRRRDRILGQRPDADAGVVAR